MRILLVIVAAIASCAGSVASAQMQNPPGVGVCPTGQCVIAIPKSGPIRCGPCGGGGGGGGSGLPADPAACASGQYVRDQDASGVLSCAQVQWSQLGAVPSTFTPSAHTHPGSDITSTVASATSAASVPWSGVTSPPATYAPSAHTHPGSDVTSTVANATAASTASALAGTPTTCGAGQAAQGITSAGNATGCFTPAGTYSLPDAAAGAKGGLELDTDLGGTAAAPQVVATHLAAALPEAQGGTGAGALTCSAGQHLTSNGTAYSCSADTAVAHSLTSATHSDVSTAAPATGDFLRYDGATWQHTALVAGDVAAHALMGAQHSDVDTAAPSTDDTIVYNSGWKHLGLGSCSGANQALTYNTTTHAFGCVTIATYAPASAQYWTAAADGTLSAEKDLSGFTGLVLNTAGTPSAKAANTCTNQFARSDNASGVWTCGSIATADLPTLDVTKGGLGAAVTPAAGTIPYGSSGTAHAELAASGTAGRDFLLSNAGAAPSWARGSRAVLVTADQSTTSTTGAATTDLTWAIAASATHAFQCVLTTIGTATSLMRFAVNVPASPTNVAFTYQSSTTSATAFGQQGQIAGAWASTCTNCTPAVTASVITTSNTFLLSGIVVNGSNSGNVTIYFAASTSGQTTTLKKGSACWYSIL